MNRQINLLVGFDAMRFFLQVQWEEDEKQSDDLADLLSNISRDVWANSQPFDIAQWSDWLDAVLSVRPDLHDVKEVRRLMQEDHHKFLQALKIEPLEAQRKALDELRSKASERTWHRIGHYPISIMDAYEAMRVFLSAYWSRGGKLSRDIGVIMDDLKREEAAPRVAQWDAWLAAIKTAKSQADRQN